MAKEFDDLEERQASTLKDYLKSYWESTETFGWIWRELVSDKTKRWARIFAVLVFAQTIVEMLSSLPIRYLADGAIAKNEQMVIYSLIAYSLLHIIPRLINWFGLYVRNHIAVGNWARLDQRLNELFFQKSLGQHTQQSSYLSSASMEKGRARVINVEEIAINDALNVAFGISIVYVLLWFMSWFAGFVASILFVSMVCWSLYLNRQVMINCLPLEREFRAYNQYRGERWEHVERVKVCGKEIEETEYMNERVSANLEKERQFWKWYDSMKTIRGLTNSIGVIAIVAYAIYQVYEGIWSVGILFPLISWSGYVKDNLWRLGELEHQLNWNLPSVHAMKGLLEKPCDIDINGLVHIDPSKNIRVELKNVSHAYPVGAFGVEDTAENIANRLVLKNVSFSIEPGEKVALIGESGAGKTTTMKLLYRASDPTSGQILINGIDLREINLKSWCQSIGYIAQKAQVFDGTIRYNLVYLLSEEERARVKDEELWSLMRKLKIDFGQRLTHGLDTVVGKNGIELSGGQAQRLMIGAAVIAKPRFVIIDEATSSLDSTTEKEVQRGLEVILGGDVSALIITHRLSAVRTLCTKFVVMRSLDILHNGDNQVEAVASSFEELYEISPTFRRLADDQDIVIQNKQKAA